MGYYWPGNVRELENAMERAVAVARFDELVLEDLPPQILGATGKDAALPTAMDGELSTMQIVEDRYIQKVLEAVGEALQDHDFDFDFTFLNAYDVEQEAHAVCYDLDVKYT